MWCCPCESPGWELGLNVVHANTGSNGSGDGRSLLAWARWQLTMPADWRPLKLMGTPGKGQMIVGDAVAAFFSIHWEQVRQKSILDGSAWVRTRLGRHGVLPRAAPPAARHFSACGWAHDVQTQEGKQTTLWYGYAANADLVIGIKVNGVLPDEQRNRVTREVLPSLCTSPADGDSTWSMYDVSFEAPAGFQLVRRHLYAGDVALEFRRAGERLMLRQVYPGDLALGRRRLERWLDAVPFLGHRRVRRRSTTTSGWQHASRQGLTGLWREGRKRLNWPLGWIAPRHAAALAVHDPGLNRLLIAEHSAATAADRAICEKAIDGMNRPGRGGA